MRGKEAKAALVAGTRKLIVLANALVAGDRPWQDTPPRGQSTRFAQSTQSAAQGSRQWQTWQRAESGRMAARNWPAQGAATGPPVRARQPAAPECAGVRCAPWHQVLLLEGGQAASLLGPLAAEQAGRLARRGEPFRAGNCLAHRTLGSRGGPEGGRCASAGTAGSRRLAPRSRLPANADAHLSLEKAMTIRTSCLDPRVRNPLQ